MSKLEEAIKYFEGAIKDSDEIIAEYSPELRKELTIQKGHFEIALKAMKKQAATGCTFKCTDDDANLWECSKCKGEWVLTGDGGPKEHNMRCCPFCGCRIVNIVEYNDGDYEEDAG